MNILYILYIYFILIYNNYFVLHKAKTNFQFESLNPFIYGFYFESYTNSMFFRGTKMCEKKNISVSHCSMIDVAKNNKLQTQDKL